MLFFKKSKTESKMPIIESGTLYDFDSELNSNNNLRTALQLLDTYSIKKGVPRLIMLCHILIYDGGADGGWLGYTYYLKTTQNNRIIIYKDCVFSRTQLVDIKIKKLKTTK